MKTRDKGTPLWNSAESLLSLRLLLQFFHGANSCHGYELSPYQCLFVSFVCAGRKRNVIKHNHSRTSLHCTMCSSKRYLFKVRFKKLFFSTHFWRIAPAVRLSICLVRRHIDVKKPRSGKSCDVVRTAECCFALPNKEVYAMKVALARPCRLQCAYAYMCLKYSQSWRACLCLCRFSKPLLITN